MKFFKYFAPCYFGVGDSPEEADADMRAEMNSVNAEYQAGRRVDASAKFQILAEGDPGGGGPCAAAFRIDPAQIVLDVRSILRQTANDNGDDD